MGDHSQRVEAILTSALDLAESGGVAGVTTAALARRLQFTEAALYRYFSGKGAIIAASLRYLGERLFTTMLIELMPEAVGHGQAVEQQLTQHAERFAYREGLLLELLVAAAGGRDPDLHAAGDAFVHQYAQRMAEYFAALQRQGTIGAAASADELSRLWVCQLLGGFVRTRLTREVWDPIGQTGFAAFLGHLRALVAVASA